MQVITDLADALLWIKRTFFYVRVRKNQVLYGFEHATNESDLENLLMKTCADAIEKLGNVGIVDYKVEDGCTVSPNIEAHLMSRHMIKFSTMVLVMKIDATANICTLLKEVRYM